MLGQAIVIAAGLGLVSVSAYFEHRAKPGVDWVLGALITAGLLLTAASNVPASNPLSPSNTAAATDLSAAERMAVTAKPH